MQPYNATTHSKTNKRQATGNKKKKKQLSLPDVFVCMENILKTRNNKQQR